VRKVLWGWGGVCWLLLLLLLVVWLLFLLLLRLHLLLLVRLVALLRSGHRRRRILLGQCGNRVRWSRVMGWWPRDRVQPHGRAKGRPRRTFGGLDHGGRRLAKQPHVPRRRRRRMQHAGCRHDGPTRRQRRRSRRGRRVPAVLP
jgi:hypothetical protein